MRVGPGIAAGLIAAGLAGEAIGQGTDPLSAVPAPLAARSLLLDGTRAGDRLVVVGERGHILLSDDNGSTWRQAEVPTRATLTAVAFPDPKQGWAVGHDAVILESVDAGETWSIRFMDVDLEVPLLDIAFADQQTGFATGAYGLYMETIDGGRSWRRRPVDAEEFHLNAIALPPVAMDGGAALMAGEFGGLYRRAPGEVDWRPVAGPYDGSLFGALALGDDVFLAFGLQGNVLRSADGGLTWTNIATGSTAGLMGGSVLDDGGVVLVGLLGTVLLSGDGGQSFRSVRRPDRAGLAAVVEAADGALILLGENGASRTDLQTLDRAAGAVTAGDG